MSGLRLSKFKIRESGREIDPSEILLDSLAKSKESQFGISEKKLETPISRKVLQGFLVSFFLILSFFFAKTFQMQVIEGKEYLLMSKENQFAIRSIAAERGVIYDSNMNQLVFNQPSFDLSVLTSSLPKEESERNRILKRAAEITGKDYQEIKKMVEESKLAELVIVKDISHQNIILLESEKENLQGLEIISNAKREYFSGSLFSHILGYKRQTGQTAGLESYYDDILTSKEGELYIERDALGKPISKEIASMPESGNSLVLWLNSGLQEIIASSLANSMERVGGTGAAAVAIDPKTGGVLALVSLPSYDSNLFSQGISQEDWQKLQNDSGDPLFNRVISGYGYPTGSSIKPIIGVAALEEEVISADTKIPCPLEICIENPYFEDAEPQCYADWKYHGASDIERAIAESVNTFFYQIGGGYEDFKGLGPTKIKEWLSKFNWGTATGIDLPKEGDGILPDLEDEWTTGDTYHLSIGQGPFSITPIQVVSAFAAIANGGKIYQPQIVKTVVDSQKEIIEEKDPKIAEILPVLQSNLETVRQGMKQAVTSADGSSHALNSLFVEAAAKTGTSQTAKEDVYHNWITVFAPYDDPQIVLTIVVENVKGTSQGIPAAVLPVAYDALNWYFSK
jgi:penicillin-binding protein 2